MTRREEDRVILLVGGETDPWCAALRRTLAAAGMPAVAATNPLADPNWFHWRFGPGGESQWALELASGVRITPRDLGAVFVASPPTLAPEGWPAADLAYVHAETWAAFLGWLWSLRCPVVNRSPASVWYRRSTNLLEWSAPLRAAGLPVQRAIVTNLVSEARAFACGAAVYNALGVNASMLIETEQEWSALARIMERTHACVTRPHGAATFACVAGDDVVWSARLPAAPRLEPALRAFARATGLAWVEVAFAETASRLEVIAVEPFPVPRHFTEPQAKRIVASLCGLLGAPATDLRARAVPS
jgi:hypothetical protein